MPAYYDSEWAPDGGAFYSSDPRIEFGTPNPTAELVDHEYQHANHWLLYGNPTTKLEEDFSRLRDDSTADNFVRYQAFVIMSRRPPDVGHWPHNFISSIGRDIRLLPSWFREAWFSWLRPKPRVLIPLVWR